MAVMTYKRHPCVSLLAAVAFSGLFANHVVGHWVLLSIWEDFTIGKVDPFDLCWHLDMLRGARATVSATCVVLLLWAMFGWRATRPRWHFSNLEVAAPLQRPRVDGQGIQPS